MIYWVGIFHRFLVRLLAYLKVERQDRENILYGQCGRWVALQHGRSLQAKCPHTDHLAHGANWANSS